jgi:hypothetical protein
MGAEHARQFRPDRTVAAFVFGLVARKQAHGESDSWHGPRKTGIGATASADIRIRDAKAARLWIGGNR